MLSTMPRWGSCGFKVTLQADSEIPFVLAAKILATTDELDKLQANDRTRAVTIAVRRGLLEI